MLPFYVIGHKNPDTDAICSAIGYAALLRAVGEEPKAIAARCGEISSRTKRMLECAGLDVPMLLTDVRVTPFFPPPVRPPALSTTFTPKAIS
jgi:manganese-dependent inorganic pyrophosphatase